MNKIFSSKNYFLFVFVEKKMDKTKNDEIQSIFYMIAFNIKHDMNKYGWTSSIECYNRFMKKAESHEILMKYKEFFKDVFELFYTKELFEDPNQLW